MKHLLHELHTILANFTAMNRIDFSEWNSRLFAVMKIFEIEMFLRDIVFSIEGSLSFFGLLHVGSL